MSGNKRMWLLQANEIPVFYTYSLILLRRFLQCHFQKKYAIPYWTGLHRMILNFLIKPYRHFIAVSKLQHLSEAKCSSNMQVLYQSVENIHRFVDHGNVLALVLDQLQCDFLKGQLDNFLGLCAQFAQRFSNKEQRNTPITKVNITFLICLPVLCIWYISCLIPCCKSNLGTLVRVQEVFLFGRGLILVCGLVTTQCPYFKYMLLISVQLSVGRTLCFRRKFEWILQGEDLEDSRDQFGYQKLGPKRAGLFGLVLSCVDYE